MIVITMTACPAKLRGDLSKWLMEIDTGVYVGQASARVRDALWDRICENIQSGRAVMAYSCANEQRFAFRVHNMTWKIRDYDGIKLMMRPKTPQEQAQLLPPGFSKAARQRMANRQRKYAHTMADKLVFLDIETTGLNMQNDRIIEIGALVVDCGDATSGWSTFVKIDRPIPPEISRLTGITDAMLNNGVDLEDALKRLAEIVKGKTVVCFNRKFDLMFLQNAFRQIGMDSPIERVIDVLTVARRKVTSVANYKLSTVAEHYGISSEMQHRALADCQTLYQVFVKLNEM